MAKNRSLERYNRALRDLSSVFKSDFEALMRTLGGNDAGAKKTAASKSLSSAEDLKRLLSPEDRPPWLSVIIASLKEHGRYLDNAEHGLSVLRDIATHFASILNHEWEFATDDRTIDFDAIFEEHRAKSRVPELFESLVAALEAIARSGEIDSMRVQDTLESLIQSLRRSKDSSYFELMTSWDFVSSVGRKWLWGQLKGIPAVGPLLDAFESALNEADIEMRDLRTEIQTAVDGRIESELQSLTIQPALPAPHFGELEFRYVAKLPAAPRLADGTQSRSD